MIAFDADELSTIAGDGWLDESDTTRIRPFNLADLPCPPQSIMVGPARLRKKPIMANLNAGGKLVQASSRRALHPTSCVSFEAPGSRPSVVQMQACWFHRLGPTKNISRCFCHGSGYNYRSPQYHWGP